MTMTYPEAVSVQGNEIWILLPTLLANPNAPKITELNAVGAVRLECSLYDGLDLSAEQAKVEAPMRKCDKSTREKLGNVKWSYSDGVVIRAPQEDGTHASNRAKTALAPNTTVDIVKVEGLEAKSTTAVAVGDICNQVLRVNLGVQIPGKTGDGEAAEFAFTQGGSLALDPIFDVAAVA